MNFYRDIISYNDFSDCHDEIVVVGANSIGKWPIYGHYLQGG